MSKKAITGWLVQTPLAVGLLFAGWGFDGLGGFFAHPARAGLLILVSINLIWIFAWRLEVQAFRRGEKAPKRQPLTLGVVLALGMSLIFFLPYADRCGLLTLPGPDSLRYLGLALYAAGNVIAFIALRELGRQYSGMVTLQKDHQLIQRGIYGVVRHPIYLRALVVAVALPLLFRSWLLLPAAVLMAIFVAARIRKEEHLLAEQFGEPYQAYCRRTWRLIPYVY